MEAMFTRTTSLALGQCVNVLVAAVSRSCRSRSLVWSSSDQVGQSPFMLLWVRAWSAMMLDDGTLRGGVMSCGVRADDSRGGTRGDVKEYGEIYRRQISRTGCWRV
jgi:hypothetical protein